jgi:hypothetical protein
VKDYRTFIRRVATAVATLTVSLQPPLQLVSAAMGQSQTAKPPATTTTTTTPKTTTTAAATPAAVPVAAVPIDGGWPREYPLGTGASVLVYQPQIASWDGQKRMTAFSAVSYRSSAQQKPLLGTIKIEADTSVSTTERLVRFENMKLTEVNIQSLAKESTRDVAAQIEKAIPDDERVIALDRVVANVDKSTLSARNIDDIKADPPPIFYSKTPALMVNIDGEPIWSPIKEVDLKFAVNTNWDLFLHEPTNTYYLRNEQTWLKTTDLKGAWAPAGKLPDSFKKLPADDNFKEVKANVPGKSIKAAAVPKVFVSQTPAELILTTGEPSYVVVNGTKLLWVSNTESDVFRLGTTGPIYYLVTGRWFSANAFSGPWTFATTSLPEDFKRIPLEHARSRVLASVPGTDQAAEAVLIASIPQTARVNKKDVKAPDVSFNGEPQFEAIQTTTVERAVNTDKDIFKVDGKFYMCANGVWFVGPSATGPWEVASTIPQEIYKIPVSSSSHHVTYVTVEDDDDEWVTFAAAAGYTGMMIAWGCAVYGSGWYYPPYYGWGGYYPIYYPRYPTYGYSAWYNPYTGAYGRSAAVYGPYGGAGVTARYNPRTGTYSRGAAAYGPGGARAAGSAYNPRTGTYATTRQGSNVYGSWGSTAVQRGDDWAVTNRYTNRQTGTTTRTVRTDSGSAISRTGAGGGTVAVGDGGNIYAGNDGSVYRRQDGTWQKYDGGGNWSNTDRQPSGGGGSQLPANGANRPGAGGGATQLPATGAGTAGSGVERVGTADRAGAGTSTSRPTTTDRSTMDQLNRDSAARREGTTRTQDYGSYRGSSGSSGATRSGSVGSYRGGGGVSRGGGGGGRRR